jgi:hypothetical protein
VVVTVEVVEVELGAPVVDVVVDEVGRTSVVVDEVGSASVVVVVEPPGLATSSTKPSIRVSIALVSPVVWQSPSSSSRANWLSNRRLQRERHRTTARSSGARSRFTAFARQPSRQAAFLPACRNFFDEQRLGGPLTASALRSAGVEGIGPGLQRCEVAGRRAFAVCLRPPDVRAKGRDDSRDAHRVDCRPGRDRQGVARDQSGDALADEPELLGCAPGRPSRRTIVRKAVFT